MHVIQPLTKFFGVADEAVPELVLSQRPFCFTRFVQLAGSDFLDVVDDLGNSQ